MDVSKVKMVGYLGSNGKRVLGIEDYLPKSQYERIEHQNTVVKDIVENWIQFSHNNKFHAIFATSSIHEAIAYYRLIKKVKPDLKITALFDPNIDNNENFEYKEEGLIEIMIDYNKRYNQDFNLAKHALFKTDVSKRLAHKKPYTRIEKTPEEQIDLLIVVDQMLTGFDSKWLNTLYLDKTLTYEHIIQAFSRTNRLFGPEKPFGTIRYYRYPHTMEQNIKAAVKLYSGDKALGLFVPHLNYNLKKINEIYADIKELFTQSNIMNFEKNPDDPAERGKFAKLFKKLNDYLEASKIQGFKWTQSKYEIKDAENNINETITVNINEEAYLILALRYKELFNSGGGGISEDIPFEIEGYLTEINTGVIDTNYMNSRFEKYIKLLTQKNVNPKQLQETLDELHKSFATLSQEEQKYANIFLHEVQSGEIKLKKDMSLRDYISKYKFDAKNNEIKKLIKSIGVDEKKLRHMLSGITLSNINEFGRFDELKDTVDKTLAKKYFESLDGEKIPAYKVNIKIHNLLEKFILTGGFEISTIKK